MFNMSKSLRHAAAIALLACGCHGLPLVPPGAAVVTYPAFERWDCSLARNVFFPGGTLLIHSEEAFRANFECHANSDDRGEGSSGVDFSRAPPFPITADHAFLVRRAPLTLESKLVTLNSARGCPKGLP